MRNGLADASRRLEPGFESPRLHWFGCQADEGTLPDAAWLCKLH